MSTVTYSQLAQQIVDTLVDLLPARHKGHVIMWPDKVDVGYDQKLEQDHPGGCYAVRYLKSHASETGHEIAIFGVLVTATTASRVSKMAATVKIALQDVVSLTGHKYQFAGVDPIEHLPGWIRDTVMFAVSRGKTVIPDKRAEIEALNP